MTETPASPTDEPVQPHEPEAPAPAPTKDTKPTADTLRHTRTSGAWLALVGFGLVLVLLIVFIAQNTQKVEVSFLGWNGSTPLAVAVLIAAAAGILLTAIAGTLRIAQLRRRIRRERKR